MAIAYMRCAAYSCDRCGTVNVKKIHIFDLPEGRALPLVCECGAHCMAIVLKKDKYHIADNCAYCRQTHRYHIGKQRFWNGVVMEFCCMENGVSRFMIGEIAEVKRYAKQQQEMLDEMAEYSNIMQEIEFQNENVIVDTLERIHEIARNGNIFCTCGGDIEFCLECDSIKLTCSKCDSTEVIYAATEQDLANIMKRESIVITHSEHKPSPR